MPSSDWWFLKVGKWVKWKYSVNHMSIFNIYPDRSHSSYSLVLTFLLLKMNNFFIKQQQDVGHFLWTWAFLFWKLCWDFSPSSNWYEIPQQQFMSLTLIFWCMSLFVWGPAGKLLESAKQLNAQAEPIHRTELYWSVTAAEGGERGTKGASLPTTISSLLYTEMERLHLAAEQMQSEEKESLCWEEMRSK